MRHLTLLSLFAALSFPLLFSGCPNKPAGDGKKAAGHTDDHAHPDLGPHEGHLLEIGEEEYHAEWTHDDASGKVTIYILDGKVKDAVPIEAEAITIVATVGGKEKSFSLEPVNRTTGEKPKASQFEITDKSLVEILTSPAVTARLDLNISGKSFSPKFEAHEDHHGHKH